MQWELKVEMMELSRNEEQLIQFQEFVIQHIEKFDTQAWDMFLTCIALSEVEIKKQSEFYGSIQDRIEKLVTDIHQYPISLSASFRLQLLLQFLNELKLKT